MVSALVGAAGGVAFARHRAQAPVPAAKTDIEPQTLIDGARRAGIADARYTLVEFGDYECPICRKLAPEVRRLRAKHTEMAFVFRNLPLTGIHGFAPALSERVLSAPDAAEYWRRHDEQMALEGPISTARQKLSPPLAHSGTSGKAVDAALSRDEALGSRLALHATPTFYVCRPDGVWKLGSLAQVDELVP